MIKKYKIEGLFDYCMKSRTYTEGYKYNNDFDNALKAQQSFLKDRGYKHITTLISNIIKDHEGIDFKITEKKYNKSSKYLIVTLENTNDYWDNNFNRKHEELKEISYKIGNKLFEIGLLGLFEVNM